MKRRTFLQLSGMTTAGAILAGCQAGNEKLIPMLVPPDEGVVPGEANYYASACRSCPAGCGILVRVSEGRAKKIEGNPAHPVNRGKLCARGQAALQELYHPDRIRQPLKRSGPKGSGKFTPISWDEGLDLLVERLGALRREKSGDKLALLTPTLRGIRAEMAARFMRAFGSPHHCAVDLLDDGWLRRACVDAFDQSRLPYYDMANSRYILSFGADFVENHLSPVHYGRAFGRMRQERPTVRGYFTYVGGRMSVTGASADRWLPARPGSEGILALGMARVILEENLHAPQALSPNRAAELAEKLKSYPLDSVEERTGLPAATIAEVSREFAATRPALAMAGEALASQSNGAESVRAVLLLNRLVGNLNRPGGIYPDASAAGAGNGPADLASLIEAMDRGRIETALVHDCNPVHTVPPASGFQEALAKVPFLVSFSSLFDDTARLADLVLPDHTALESWGDVLPAAGTRTPAIGLMQPVVRPVFDTRPFADLLLTVAGELGGETAAAFPRKSYLELLKETVRKAAGLPETDFEKNWVALLQQGGLFETTQKEIPSFAAGKGMAFPEVAEPHFAGDEKDFPLHLLAYPSTAFYDGRGAALPWLQQLPDPLSTVVWGSWLEINPRTAAKLGIAFGDLVEVASPQGSLRLPAVTFPAIRPDMVAIPIGQGHQGAGRYADGRGVNPLALLAPNGETDGMPTPGATRVRVRKIAAGAELVTAGHPEGSYRNDLIEI